MSDMLKAGDGTNFEDGMVYYGLGLPIIIAASGDPSGFKPITADQIGHNLFPAADGNPKLNRALAAFIDEVKRIQKIPLPGGGKMPFQGAWAHAKRMKPELWKVLADYKQTGVVGEPRPEDNDPANAKPKGHVAAGGFQRSADGAVFASTPSAVGTKPATDGERLRKVIESTNLGLAYQKARAAWKSVVDRCILKQQEAGGLGQSDYGTANEAAKMLRPDLWAELKRLESDPACKKTAALLRETEQRAALDTFRQEVDGNMRSQRDGGGTPNFQKAWTATKRLRPDLWAEVAKSDLF